jgi:hypothetical protein
VPAEAMDSLAIDAVMLTCGAPGYDANVTLKAGIKASKGINKIGKLFKGLQMEFTPFLWRILLIE